MMEKIVGGLKYDTEKSKLVAQTEWRPYGLWGDFAGFDRQSYYETPNGRYFYVYEQAGGRSVGWFKPYAVGGVRSRHLNVLSRAEFIERVYADTGRYLGEAQPA